MLMKSDTDMTKADIAAADDDGLKIWNQIGYHSDDPMTFSADNIALPSGAYEVTVRYFSCQTPDAPTFNMLNAAGSLTFASERSPAAVTAIWSWLGRGTPDAEAVWVGFRGVLWIAASIFGVSQLPLIMKNLTKDEPPGPTSPDTGL